MKIVSSKEFGNEIRKKRKEMGYTQAFLSDVSGFSVSFISDVENGKPTVELEKVLRLANLLALDFMLISRG